VPAGLVAVADLQIDADLEGVGVAAQVSRAVLPPCPITDSVVRPSTSRTTRHTTGAAGGESGGPGASPAGPAGAAAPAAQPAAAPVPRPAVTSSLR
jgi:hypothetical protein